MPILLMSNIAHYNTFSSRLSADYRINQWLLLAQIPFANAIIIIILSHFVVTHFSADVGEEEAEVIKNSAKLQKAQKANKTIEIDKSQ